MKKYIASKKIPDRFSTLNTGQLGELIFKQWFVQNFQGESIKKSSAEADYNGIDFSDEKGYTYQIKATRRKTYTFNCIIDDFKEHLKADLYVFIQIHEKYAYIESLYNKNEILNLARQSFKEQKSCFVYAKDLLQQKLF